MGDDALPDDVVRRFVDGDLDAVRAVHDRYAGALFAVARSMTADRELAADAVQQAFVKAWRAAGGFDPERDLAPWLYAITRRATIDAIRRERRPTRGDHAPETDVAVRTMSFERTWEVFEVRHALDRLPTEEREVLRLTRLVGMTQAEAAAHLGVPVGTVKSRTHRAMARLRGLLGHVRDTGSDVVPSDEGGTR